MNPGLRFLLVRRPLGRWRQLRRRLGGVGGFLTVAGVLALVLLVLGPQLFLMRSAEFAGPFGMEPETLRTWGPPGLWLVVLTFLTQGGLYFKPAEVQFLLPAPIPRRQLVLYNVLSRLGVQVLSSLWLGIFLVSSASFWASVFVGALLLLVFLQLTAQVAGLLLAATGERAGKWGARVLWVAILGALAIGLLFLEPGAPVVEKLRALVGLPAVQGLSWLTRPFVEVLLAASPAELLRWSVPCFAVLGAELLAMVGLDRAYVRGAVQRGRTVQERIQRMRSGGGVLAGGRASRGGPRLPQPPHLGGAGPLAWRQLQELLRNPRGLLNVGLMMFLMLGVFYVIPTFGGRGQEDAPTMGSAPLVGVLVLMLAMTQNLAFDFRRDLDRMAVLKALPLRPFAVAVGQIVPMTIILVFWIAIGAAVVAFVGDAAPRDLIVLAVAAAPLAWSAVAVDNWIFLKLPYRLVPSDPGQVTMMPRVMLVMFLKFLALGVVAGSAAGVAFVAARILDLGLPGILTAVVATLVLACGLLSWTVGLAFRGFDVSRDLPD